MTRRPAARKKSSRKTGGRRKRRLRIPSPWPGAATRRHWFRLFIQLPMTLQIVIVLAAVLVMWLSLNGIYQIVRKPSELFFPVSGTLYKTPSESWRAYAPIFRRHSTRTISPELLAALAQVEGSGNPIVRTYWRWSLSSKPFEVYRPASSAVGMYQITDGTFAEARRYCIHDHVVVEDGPWNDFRSCWFNWLYARVIPGHAVELTAAYLDTRIAGILARNRIVQASARQKEDLAAVIHLCGAGAGNQFARRGFRPAPGQRCGDHNVRGYIARVNRMKRVFAQMRE